MTADLVAFLNARLDEDQAQAERMSHFDVDGEGGYYACPAARTEPVGDLLAGEGNCDCGMPARRARVLADVQAKRRMIEFAAIDGYRALWWVVAGKALASVFRDHPDFRQEWLLNNV